MLVNTSAPGWPILYANEPCENLLGLAAGLVQGRNFGELLTLQVGMSVVGFGGARGARARGVGSAWQRACCKGAPLAS